VATLSFFLLEVGAYEIKKIIFEGSGHSKLLFTNSFLVGMGCKSPGRKHKYFFYIFRTAKFLPHKPIWGSASTVNTQCATVLRSTKLSSRVCKYFSNFFCAQFFYATGPIWYATSISRTHTRFRQSATSTTVNQTLQLCI